MMLSKYINVNVNVIETKKKQIPKKQTNNEEKRGTGK